MKLETIIKPKLLLTIAVLSLLVAYPLTIASHKVATRHVPQPTVVKEKTVIAAVVKVYNFRCGQYAGIFRQYNWDVDTALAICQAESSGVYNNISDTCDRGLMQINCVHADMVNGDLGSLYDPQTNVAIAHQLYIKHGWKPWMSYKTGRYLAYL